MTDDVKQAIATLMQREWNHGENGQPVTLLRLAFEKLEDECAARRRALFEAKEIIGRAAAEVAQV